MRVISGKAKGIKLVTIEGLNTRPTTDRIKESIFNLIQFEIPDANVLDLFSGSGALGLEAASRGAASVTLVEQNRQCHKAMEENIGKCELSDVVTIMKSDVLSIFHHIGQFDVIMMDPPYQKDFITPVMDQIVMHKTLSENGVVVIEHSTADQVSETFGELKQYKQKKYGKTMISLYAYDV